MAETLEKHESSALVALNNNMELERPEVKVRTLEQLGITTLTKMPIASSGAPFDKSPYGNFEGRIEWNV